MKSQKEDCLLAIYRSQTRNRKVTKITDIAVRLNVSRKNLKEIIKKLSRDGLVHLDGSGEITLTQNGIKSARDLFRKHQLLEVFFTDVLSVKKEAHEQAHIIEHTLSGKAADKLDNFLNKPRFCPTGNPIPSRNSKVVPLTKINSGNEVEVVFAATLDTNCLNRLNAIGIVPRERIKIIRKIEHGPILLNIKGSEIALGSEICENIFVEKI